MAFHIIIIITIMIVIFFPIIILSWFSIYMLFILSWVYLILIWFSGNLLLTVWKSLNDKILRQCARNMCDLHSTFLYQVVEKKMLSEYYWFYVNFAPYDFMRIFVLLILSFLVVIFPSWNFVLCSLNLRFVVKDFWQREQWENVLPSPWVALIWCLRGVGSV